jgi:hypothetical protein
MRASSSNSRYLDHGVMLWTFADEVLVRCIRCNTPGRVRVAAGTDCRLADFECAACGLKLPNSQTAWVGTVAYVGRRPCGHCGHQWLKVELQEEVFPHAVHEQATASCPECARDSKVLLKVETRTPHDRSIDPHFGLPLLLLTETRHGLVWAYNARHLQELHAYVAAKLRERRGGDNTAMFSRLPAWMKAAKSRAEILKALEELASRLSATPIGQAPRVRQTS